MLDPGPLWVVGAPTARRWGNVLHSASGLPAVMWQPHTYPDRPDLESRELLSLLCAGVIGLAETVRRAGVSLGADLDRWVSRSAPAADLGPGRPAVLSVDGQRMLGLRWGFDDLTAVGTVAPTGYVFALVAGAPLVIELRSLDIEDPAQGP